MRFGVLIALLSSSLLVASQAQAQSGPPATTALTIHTSFGDLHAWETVPTHNGCGQGPDHGAMLLIPGPLVNADSYHTGVAGYDADTEFASRGYTSLAVDPPGTNGSFSPPNGRTVNAQYMHDVYSEVIDFMRDRYDVRRVHLYREGGCGGDVVQTFSADDDRVATVIQAGNVYREATPALLGSILSPFFQFITQDYPIGYAVNGYFNTSLLGPFSMAGAPANVNAALVLTQSGNYPLGYYGDLVTRAATTPMAPIFDIRTARVPGLDIIAAEDPIATLADHQQYRTDYGSLGGGRSILRVTPAGCHDPRLGSATSAAFWQYTFDFLDDHDQGNGHGNGPGHGGGGHGGHGGGH